jgi:hypothetical protein
MHTEAFTYTRQTHALPPPRLFQDRQRTMVDGRWLRTDEHSAPINHQPSTISHQPSTINHQPSAISHQPLTINY